MVVRLIDNVGAQESSGFRWDLCPMKSPPMFEFWFSEKFVYIFEPPGTACPLIPLPRDTKKGIAAGRDRSDLTTGPPSSQVGISWCDSVAN